MKFGLPITLSLRNKIHSNTMKSGPHKASDMENCLAGQSLSRAIYLMIVPEKLRLGFKNKKEKSEVIRWAEC
jgi:hypothetical protein